MTIKRNETSIEFRFEESEEIKRTIEFDELMIAIRKVRKKADELHLKYLHKHFEFKDIDLYGMKYENIRLITTQMKSDGWELIKREVSKTVGSYKILYKYKRERHD